MAGLETSALSDGQSRDPESSRRKRRLSMPVDFPYNLGRMLDRVGALTSH
jgi:hypothetical protein